MAYAKGGLAMMGKEAKELFQDIGEVAQVPGGIEMLFTMAAQERGDKGSKKLRLYSLGGRVEYAGGGLAMAEQVRDMGRGDDEVLLHVSPEEYEALVGMWGEPDINPRTGVPEYGFLSKLWKKVKKTVKKIVKSPVFSFLAPIALNTFAPGLGAAIGKGLGLAGGAASTVGNTLVRAGLGGVSGGKEGALSGAVSGLTRSGLGTDIGTKLGLEGAGAKMAGDAVIGGIGGEVGGGGFTQGALGNVVNAIQTDALRPIEDSIGSGMKRIFQPGAPEMALATEGMSPVDQEDIFGTAELMPTVTGEMSPVGAPSLTSAQPNILERGWGWVKDNPLLAAGLAGTAYSMLSSPDEAEPPAGAGLPPGFNDPIPQFDFTRDRSSIDPMAYYTYGQVGAPQQGEATFFENNTIGTPAAGTDPIYGTPASNLTEDQLGLLNLDINPTGHLSSMLKRLQEQAQADLGWHAPTGAARGGHMEYDDMPQLPYSMQMQEYMGGGHSKGHGSGRDDTIEALLSDGEYVMDAETVSLLGDGSNDEGARRLDEMREELRKHKGQNLRKGKFSQDAKKPMQYLGKKRRYAKGGRVKELKKSIDDLYKKRATTVGHNRRFRINERIERLEAELKKLEGKKEKKARGGKVSTEELTNFMASKVTGE